MGGSVGSVVLATRRPRDRVADGAILVALLVLAAVGWWWSARMADDMSGDMGAMDGMGEMGGASAGSMSLLAFLGAWVAMMAAMMFPSVSPMVRLYARAAARGNVAPVPFFVGGYLLTWAALGLPAYLAWRALEEPLAEGATWTGRLAGAIFLAAAAYQLSPLKDRCLQHCRSPLSFFLHHAGTTTDTPLRAVRLGAHHGAFCIGCCWALMAVLVAVGTMHLGWMAALTAVILVEKLAPAVLRPALVTAVVLAIGGVVLLVEPSTITDIA